MTLPVHRFLNHIYWWCVQRVSAEDLPEWEMMLAAPLPGEAKKAPTPFTVEEEGESFMALMAATQGE